MSNKLLTAQNSCYRCDNIVYLHKAYNAIHGDYPHQLQFYLAGIPSMFTISYKSTEDLDKDYDFVMSVMEED